MVVQLFTIPYPQVFLILISSYLVAAAGLQSFWSLSLAIIDIYALLVRRSLQNYRIVSLFTIGDGVRKPHVILAKDWITSSTCWHHLHFLHVGVCFVFSG